jgi:hypothetical protein
VKQFNAGKVARSVTVIFDRDPHHFLGGFPLGG